MIFEGTINVLESALDLYLLRHGVISDNIANAETPGFKARRVDFEGQLQRAIKEHDMGVGIPNRNIASVEPRIYEDPESEVGLDRNSVDMDREMARLTKNDVQYSAAANTIAKKFALLKYAIKEGNAR